MKPQTKRLGQAEDPTQASDLSREDLEQASNPADDHYYFCDDDSDEDLVEVPPEEVPTNHRQASNYQPPPSAGFVFSDQDTTHQARRRCKAVAEWAILLVSLAEALFTTYFFDEDQFSFFTIALVFGVFAFCDSLAKTLASCTRTKCDDFVVALISEGIQAYLYLYFCDFSKLSLFWIPVMGGMQWILIYIVFVCTPWNKTRQEEEDENLKRRKQECGEEEDEEEGQQTKKVYENDQSNEEGIFLRTVKFVGSKTIGITVALSPLLYLLTQPQSPFRTKDFEVLLTAYLWVCEVGTTQFYKDFNPKSFERFIQKLTPSPVVTQQQQQQTDDEKKSCFYGAGLLAVFLVITAFAIYTMVLSWVWWYDPEIEDRYDKILTMIFMVCSAMWGCCFCFYGCLGCLVCCFVAGGDDPEDNNDNLQTGETNRSLSCGGEEDSFPDDGALF